MNKENFKKYAIGFVVCLALLAVLRLVLYMNGNPMKSEAAPLEDMPLLYQAGEPSPFWWAFGLSSPTQSSVSTTTCIILMDDQGNRYYYCGPSQGGIQY